ncbi:flagellin lysine-N-methylase [Niallia sp. MER 6]|uniref:flagellin lysine-N-methylase n=1 Tax=Niallia sp. MER 6 TaxID=2939567 RepID=UPI00203E7981|nr:flagellin lysine-N-methylase [Niallia sp. MER 6]MCM3029678.1 flagellin lysine-N-methylase [Niallia sp. MER 6]
MKGKLFQPVYLNAFKCIGSECEDTCCANWTIAIDKKSYKKYKNVADREFQTKLKEGITRVKDTSKTNENLYAQMKLDENNQCNFLTENRLCGIQQKLGESFLCNTCSVYPRIINKLDDTLERSGTISCPEVARLALLNKKGIEFESFIGDVPYKIYQGELQRKAYKTNSLEHNFWDIRYLIIEVLQERKLRLWERLLYVGIFIQKLQTGNFQNEMELTNLISTFRNTLKNSNVSDLFSQVPVKIEMQFKILQLIAEARQNEGINHPKFEKYYNEFLTGIKYSSLEEEEKNIQNYIVTLESFLETEEEFEYIFENYLVNQAFNTMFPLNPDGNYMREFGYLILHYALIRLHLVGIKAYQNGNLNDNEIVSFIQSFSRNVGHNKGYLRKIYKFLEENSLDNIGAYTILLKNKKLIPM